MPKAIQYTALDERQSKLVEDNMPLVNYMVNRMRDVVCASGLGYDDAVAAGNLGLCRAAKRYKPDRGAKFSTYAGRAIYMSILDAAQKTHPMMKRTYAKDPSKLPRVFSLDAPILADNNDSGHISVHDTIADASVRFNDMEARDDVDEVRGMVDRALWRAFGDDAKSRRAAALCARGMKQYKVGRVCGFAQPYVSRIYAMFKQALRDEIDINKRVAKMLAEYGQGRGIG
jgi:RNA polymerase sigma factor (sigma-70 family)